MNPITEDHSLVAELVRSGDLTRDQAAEHPQKNLITRALGAEEEVDVDTTVLPIEAGDRVLLCSDGLSDMVPETRISEILLDTPDDPSGRRASLLSAALDAGGNDNITVVVVDVKEQARAAAPRRPARGAPAPARCAPWNLQVRPQDDRTRRRSPPGGPRAGRSAPQGRAPQAPERLPAGARQARQGACDRGWFWRIALDTGLPLGVEPVLLRVRRRGGGRVPGPALRALWGSSSTGSGADPGSRSRRSKTPTGSP